MDEIACVLIAASGLFDIGETKECIGAARFKRHRLAIGTFGCLKTFGIQGRIAPFNREPKLGIQKSIAPPFGTTVIRM